MKGENHSGRVAVGEVGMHGDDRRFGGELLFGIVIDRQQVLPPDGRHSLSCVRHQVSALFMTHGEDFAAVVPTVVVPAS